jgi:hypothetical protein
LNLLNVECKNAYLYDKPNKFTQITAGTIA